MTHRGLLLLACAVGTGCVVHGWSAELDAKGRTLREEVGEVLPDHGASFG